MAGLRRLLPLVALLGLISSVFAQAPSVTLKFVEYPQYLTPEDLQQGTLTLKLSSVVNSTGYTITDPTLYVYVTNYEGRILYSITRTVTLYNGSNVIKIYLPGDEIASKLSQSDGVLNVKADLYVTFSNDTDVVSKEVTDKISIAVNSNTLAGDLDVVYVAPDLTKLTQLDRKTYTFVVGIKNDGDSEADNVGVHIKVYDEYGSKVIDKVDYISIDPKEYVESKFNINFGILQPGYYTVEIEVDKDKLTIYDKTYNVVVAPMSIRVVQVLSTEIIPPKYKPGDLILVKMVIKNSLDRAVSVTPEIVSGDLNVYRELSTINLAPEEVKTFQFVVPLPNTLAPGDHTITVKFLHDGVEDVSTVKVHIPGEKKILTAELSGVKPLKVGENETLKLRITTNVEDLIPLRVDVDSQGLKVKVPERVYVGGVGLTRVIDVKVEGVTPGKGLLKVVLIDERTGKTLATLEKVVKVYSGVNKTANATAPGIVSPSREEDVLKLIAIVVGALVVIVAGYLIFKRKEEEERPSE